MRSYDQNSTNLIAVLSVAAALMSALVLPGCEAVKTAPTSLDELGNDMAPFDDVLARMDSMAREVRAVTDVFIINPDGTGERRLTDTPAEESTPSLSPDGTSLVFESGRVIHITRPDGSERKALMRPDNELAFTPCWSPDGKQLCVVLGNNPAHLYAYDVEESTFSKLTDTPGVSENSPSWSPDGSKIAYVRSVEEGPTQARCVEIWMRDRDGSNARCVVSHFPKLTIPRNPQWFPDGKSLAFVLGAAEMDEMRGDVYQFHLDGNKLLRLTEDDCVDPLWLAVSPSDGTVLYVPARDYTQDATGRKAVERKAVEIPLRKTVYANHIRFVTLPYVRDATWTCDGQKIVFTKKAVPLKYLEHLKTGADYEGDCLTIFLYGGGLALGGDPFDDLPPLVREVAPDEEKLGESGYKPVTREEAEKLLKREGITDSFDLDKLYPEGK